MTDPILYWNDVALEANRISHSNGKNENTGPVLSARALAIVHLAMHDAYVAITNTSATPTPYLPYLPGLAVPPAGASADAAVAAAAYATLFNLYPSQVAFFDSKKAGAGLVGAGLAQGDSFGLMIAQKILDDRKLDPGAASPGYVPSNARGRHRVDPDNSDQGFYGAFFGARSKCFAVTQRHDLNPPPPLGTADYNKAVNEVWGKGIAPELTGTLATSLPRRSVEETVIGVFWGYDGANLLGTPPRLYNQIVRQIAIAQANAVTANARLFALVNVAMADAGILSWEQKYHYDLWRPVLGVREHDESMGPLAANSTGKINGDPYWLPLGAPKSNALVNTPPDAPTKNFTPNFPAYPSGHATFGGVAFYITRLFYGVTADGPDNLADGLIFVSDEMNGINMDNKGTVRTRHTREFPGGLWQMMEENGASRVYLGVHWIFDAFVRKNNGQPDYSKKIGGVRLGIDIAKDIYTNGMTKSTV